MQQWALYYASQGIPVYPIDPQSRTPYAGSHGVRDATTDTDTIVAWWAARPDSAIATRPQLWSVCALDIDPRSGGLDTFEILKTQYPGLESPLMAETPRGGFHIYFRTPEGKHLPGSLGPGVEIKYRGQITLPPSRSKYGEYRWINGPDAIPADLPVGIAVDPVERKAIDGGGSLDDVDLIRQALDVIDPDEYGSWIATMASLHHWSYTTPGGEDIGYELARQWSAQSSKHTDETFHTKWLSFDPDRPGSRSIGSVFHDAGISPRPVVDPSVAFADPAVLPHGYTQPDLPPWTTEPLTGYRGEADPAEALAEAVSVSAKMGEWWATDPISFAAFISGGSCDQALDILSMRSDFHDTDSLRVAIAYAVAGREGDFYRTIRLTDEQTDAPILSADDSAMVHAYRVCHEVIGRIPSLYQRGCGLVRVRSDGAILEHDVASLGHLLDTHIRFEKGDKGIPARAPDMLIRRILGSGEYPGILTIRGVARLPYIGPDGSIHTTPEVDPRSGLMLVGGTDWRPKIGLTDDDLESRVEAVMRPFRDFVWIDSLSQSVLMTALLTAVCRPALTTAPSFLVSAATAGSGKTLVSSILSVLAGGDTSVMALSSDRAEVSKTLTAKLKTGAPSIVFDNVSTLKAHEELCAVMTAPIYESRILGGSYMAALENRALWVLNGNNVIITQDLVRRVLPMRLAPLYRPEMIRHDFDPLKDIQSDLTTYRGHLIELLRAYVDHGSPVSVSSLGSFSDWSDFVRGCVIWLGFDDPVDVIAASYDEDPSVELLTTFTAIWYERFGLEPVSTTQLLSTDPGKSPETWRETIDAICGGSSKLLGYYLRRHKDIECHGFRIVRSDRKTVGTRWKLENAK